MATFRGMDGKFYEEYQASSHETERDACQWVEAQGGVLSDQKMVGAIYRAQDGRTFRVTSRGWAPGYVVLGTRAL